MAGALPTDPGPYEGTSVDEQFEDGFHRRYPDGTLRGYIPYPDVAARKIWQLQYRDVSWDQFAVFEAFWAARANTRPLSAANFTFPHPVTGATLTGIFVTKGTKLGYQITASCRVSFSLTIEEIAS